MKRALSLLFLLVAGCASGPSQPATAPVAMKVGNYNAEMGPSPVGVIPVATLHDVQRNKNVEVSIEYPTRGGPFPIIIFSHGYGSSDHAYEPLISYWTSNGYVCIRPSHADAGQLREPSREITTPPASPREQGRRRPSQQQGIIIPLQQNNPAEQIWDREREAQWQNRVADIELVINSLETLERQFPELVGKMDQGKIVVGGHGYGAFTALLIGGMRTFSSPPLQLADPRVRAIVAMSPPGVSQNRGTTSESFTGLHLPLLFMTGTNDRGANESEDANWRKQAFEDSPPGDKFFVFIDGARYASFTGQVGFFEMAQPTRPAATNPYGQPVPQQQQPPGAMVFSNDRQIFNTVKITSLAFWDAYLKNDTNARDLLQPQKYESSFGAAHLTVK
jgi:predicted dienelactone hydrolase